MKQLSRCNGANVVAVVTTGKGFRRRETVELAVREAIEEMLWMASDGL
jgi:hypothetical protein